MDNNSVDNHTKYVDAGSMMHEVFGEPREPHIYEFRVPELPGCIKVGDTTRPVGTRIGEWRVKYPDLELLGSFPATVVDKDGTKYYYRDYGVHDTMSIVGANRADASEFPDGMYYSREFFHSTEKQVDDAHRMIIDDFAGDRVLTKYYTMDSLPVKPTFKRGPVWEPRENQLETVRNFSRAVANGRTNLLMFAVMRYGKTFTSLLCAKEYGAKRVLVVSAKADVRDEWRYNVLRPGNFDGWVFLDRDDLEADNNAIDNAVNNGHTAVVFATLQDLNQDPRKPKKRYRELMHEHFDVILVDESHYGARSPKYGAVLRDDDSNAVDVDDAAAIIGTLKGDVRIHLSGTPYRILMSNEFQPEDIIATVQQTDMRIAEKVWYEDPAHLNDDTHEWDNPYYGIPDMVRFGFNLNDSTRKMLDNYRDGNGDYSLSEMFRALAVDDNDSDGMNGANGKSKRNNPVKKYRFVHEKEVLDFLRALDDGNKNPDSGLYAIFNDPTVKRNNLMKHVVMVLPYKASCDAMQQLLENHRDEYTNLAHYRVINISGKAAKGKSVHPDVVKTRVAAADDAGERTITLTVNRMLTGCTVPPWDTMLFLREASSAQEYFQAMYRIQSSYVKNIADDNGNIISRLIMKPQTMFIDFQPNRILSMEEQEQQVNTILDGESGNTQVRKRIMESIKWSPIILANGNNMARLDAANVMDAVNDYRANRSIMDEERNSIVDLDVMNDEIIRRIVLGFNRLDKNKGVFKASNAINVDANTGANTLFTLPTIDSTANNEHTVDTANNGNNADTDNSADRENRKTLKDYRERLHTMNVKILFYAMLTDDRVESMDDMLESMYRAVYDDGPVGKRTREIIGHLGLNVAFLERLRHAMNPFILRQLDYRIANVNRRMRDEHYTPLERARQALESFTRISSSEVFTPEHVADEMVRVVPPERVRSIVDRGGKILDIAGKAGEFASAWYRYMVDDCGIDEEQARDAVLTIPTSGTGYEFTRKIYETLGMSTDNIASRFTSYDLLEKYMSIPETMVDGEQKRDAGIIKEVLEQRNKPFSEVTLNDDVNGDGESVKIDVIVGNPPYQMDASGDRISAISVYNVFMDIANSLSDESIMITPARFLFRVGNTPKTWWMKMLGDPHFHVVKYYENSNTVFGKSVDIKGGIVISCYNNNETYEPIGTFIPNKVMRSIYDKTMNNEFTRITIHNSTWIVLDKVRTDFPNLTGVFVSTGHVKRIESNCFDEYPNVFLSNAPDDGASYTKIYGLSQGKRCYRYLNDDYLVDYTKNKTIDDETNLTKYKVILPKANGSGVLGETLSNPFIIEPGTGYTRTYISIGDFANKNDADACLKYVKSKYARFMLGTLKTTQNNYKDTWANVPQQDFTEDSDIDWSKTIPEIDQQLYAKYGLDDEEIEFIETHVQPME